MTIGDIVEKARLAFGGVTRDEQELVKLKEGRLALQDRRLGERRKKDSLASLIKDKQAELKVTSLKQNQVSIAKEIMQLKGRLDAVQKTEDEITGKIDVLDALISEKEREINARESAAAGATIDKIEVATDKREDRLADNEDLNKAMSGLVAADGTASESAEDIDALLAAAMSDDAASAKAPSETTDAAPAEAKKDAEQEVRTAPAAAPAEPASAQPGVAAVR